MACGSNGPRFRTFLAAALSARVLLFIWTLAAFYAVGWLLVPLAHHFAADTPWHAHTQRLWSLWGEPMSGDLPLGGDMREHGFIALGVIAITGLLLARGAELLRDRRGESVFVRYVFAFSLLPAIGFYLAMAPSPASESSKSSTIISQLQTIRSQLELYQLQHNGKYPPLDRIWAVLTNETDVDGNILAPSSPLSGTIGAWGPYLQQPPINVFTNESRVTANNTGSWMYDETTGEIRVIMPPEMIERVFPAGENTADIATMDLVTFSPEWWFVVRIRAMRATHRVAFVLTPVILVVTWVMLLCRTVKGHAARSDYRAILRALGICSCAGALMLACAEPWQHSASKIAFGMAALFASFMLIVMRLRGGEMMPWFEQNHCRHCDYDLTGTLAACRDTCPECGKGIDTSQRHPAPGRVVPTPSIF